MSSSSLASSFLFSGRLRTTTRMRGCSAAAFAAAATAVSPPEAATAAPVNRESSESLSTGEDLDLLLRLGDGTNGFVFGSFGSGASPGASPDASPDAPRMSTSRSRSSSASWAPPWSSSRPPGVARTSPARPTASERRSSSAGETNSGAKSSSFAVFIALTGVLCSTAMFAVGSSAMFSCALTVFKSLKSFCLSAMSDTPCLG